MKTNKLMMASFLACSMAGSSQGALIGHFEFDGDLTDSVGNYTAMVISNGAANGSNVNLSANPGELTLTNPNSSNDIDILGTDYTPGDSGSFAFRYQPGGLYNFNSIFANSAQQDDWEMWTYGDGRTRGRVQGDSAVTVAGTEAGVDHHYAFTWEKTGATTVTVSLYQDGALVETNSAGSWVDPGNLLIGGGPGTGNDGGNGIYDDFRIYDHALSAGEVATLAIPEPSSAALLGLCALTALGRRRS